MKRYTGPTPPPEPRDDYAVPCEDCARTFATWPDYEKHVVDTHGHPAT